MDSIAQSLVDDILGGKLDEHLDTIIDSARTRKNAKAKLQVAQLGIGAKVRIKDIRPKYMTGITGTIDSRERTRLRIKLDDASLARLDIKGGHRYLGPNGTIKVPETCVEPA